MHVQTSHLEVTVQILRLRSCGYREWYLWAKKARGWMKELVKREKGSGTYGDSRERVHWIVEWINECENALWLFV